MNCDAADDEQMIQCDVCSNWWLFSCAKVEALSRAQIKALNFRCPACRPTKKELWIRWRAGFKG